MAQETFARRTRSFFAPSGRSASVADLGAAERVRNGLSICHSLHRLGLPLPDKSSGSPILPAPTGIGVGEKWPRWPFPDWGRCRRQKATNGGKSGYDYPLKSWRILARNVSGTMARRARRILRAGRASRSLCRSRSRRRRTTS